MDYQKLCKSLIYQTLSSPQDEFFDKLRHKIDDYFLILPDGSVNTFSNTKNKNKLKGNLFEYICLGLIKLNIFRQISCKNAWLFSEIPDDLKIFLGFRNKDMGIDIVVQTTTDTWIAVQCKYKKEPTYKKSPNGHHIRWQVNWKTLSTFYSLCERTGPQVGVYNDPTKQVGDHADPAKQVGGWYKRVVITTAQSVNRQGHKNDKDISICINTFRSINKDIWLKFIGDIGHKCSSHFDVTNIESIKDKDAIDKEELRLKRLAFYNK